MSDTAPTVEAPKPAPPEQAPSTEAPKLPDDHPLVKALAAQKDEIKTLKAKASRLDEIEEANKTAEEKAAERLAAAEKAAAQAEAKALRREIALEHKLDPTDAALLDNLTDEDAIRSLAARLAPSENPGPRQPRPDAAQGRSGAGGPKSTADSFADFFEKSLPGR